MTAARARRPAAAPERPAEGQALAPVCVIDGCTEPVLHRGLCAAHWEDPRRTK